MGNMIPDVKRWGRTPEPARMARHKALTASARGTLARPALSQVVASRLTSQDTGSEAKIREGLSTCSGGGDIDRTRASRRFPPPSTSKKFGRPSLYDSSSCRVRLDEAVIRPTPPAFAVAPDPWTVESFLSD